MALAMGAEARLRMTRMNPMVEDRRDLIEQAKEHAQKAIALEPRDLICLLAGGRALTHSGQHGLAISRIEEAVALNPNYAMGHFSLGCALVAAGQPEEAISKFDDALRLSPHDALSAVFRLMRAEALFDLGRFEESAKWSRQATQSQTIPFWGFVFLAAAAAELGHDDEAKSALQEVYRRVPDFSLEHVRQNLQEYKSEAVHGRLDALRKAGVTE